jgi:predicted transposase YdaD
MNNVVNTSRQEGRKEGQEEGIEMGQRSLILRQLTRRIGVLPDNLNDRIQLLPIDQLAILAEDLLDFSGLNDLVAWMDGNQ